MEEDSATVQRRRNMLALHSKVEAIRLFEKTQVYKTVADHFNCCVNQIKRIVTNKEEILKEWNSMEINQKGRQKKANVKILSQAVYAWIQRHANEPGFTVTDDLIKKQAHYYRNILDIPTFYPIQKWVDNFRRVYNLTSEENATATTTATSPPSNKAEIFKEWVDLMMCQGGNNQKIVRMEALNRAVQARIKMDEPNGVLTDEIIETAALEVREACRLRQFSPDEKWIENFRKFYESQSAANGTDQNKTRPDNHIKPKNVLALNEKIAAIRRYERDPVYKNVARYFNCSPEQIKRIIQQKEHILTEWKNRKQKCQVLLLREMKTVKISFIGKAVHEWIRRMMYFSEFLLTDACIQTMAIHFQKALRLANFFPDKLWIANFRNTYNLTEVSIENLDIGYRESKSVQIEDIIADLQETYGPSDPECAPSECKRFKHDDTESTSSFSDNEEPEHRTTPRPFSAQRSYSRHSATSSAARSWTKINTEHQQNPESQQKAEPQQSTEPQRNTEPQQKTEAQQSTEPQRNPESQQKAAAQQSTEPQRNPEPQQKTEAPQNPEFQQKTEAKQKTEPQQKTESQQSTVFQQITEPKPSTELQQNTKPQQNTVLQQIQLEEVDLDPVKVETDGALITYENSMTSESQQITEPQRNPKPQQKTEAQQNTEPQQITVPQQIQLEEVDLDPVKVETDETIITYENAMSYVKQLEEFALLKENFRLIGLVERLEEALKENQ